MARLGQGGMATVYLALVAGPGGFNKLMVVKVLRDDLMGGSEEAVKMFWSEARLSAQLVHPNIVHTFEVGELDGRYFMAMEYLDGQTLRGVQNRANARGGIPLAESLRILAEVARGLHYSHQLKSYKGEALGVVHRDMSPQNVMVTYDGQVKVLDFGIAKMRNAESMTQAGMIKGKLEYVAPEQLRGDAVDGRADVFSLGAMLWEAVTGERFAGGHQVAEVAKVHARLVGGERKVRELKPDVPEPLAQIVDRAIAVDRNARFESGAAFASAVEQYLATLPEKPNAQTLAAFLEPLFAADRARIHQLIDEQIERSQTGSGHLLQLGGDPQSTSGVFVGEGSSAGRPVGREAVPTVGAKRSRTVLWVAGGCVLVAAASLLIFSMRSNEVHAGNVQAPRDLKPAAIPSAPEPTPTMAPVAPLVPTADQNAERSVLLDVQVRPATARLMLDGATLPVPFHGRFRKSDSLHMVEAIAEGYQPFKRLIPFEQDQVLTIELVEAPQQQAVSPTRRTSRNNDKPTAARIEQPAQPVAPTPPPATPAAEEPGPGQKMNSGGTSIRRRLIVNDPYAK